MLAIFEIEESLKNEEYEEALIKTRRALMEDSSNPILFYYLFICANNDYLNIDFNNVSDEINFNRALELSTKRQREVYEAEYRLFKTINPKFRNYFAYAIRDRVNEFYSYIEDYGIPKDVSLYDDNDDFFNDLEVYTTGRLMISQVDMNLLAINLLYLSTKRNELLSVYNSLKEIAINIRSNLSGCPFCKNLDELKEEAKILIGKEKAQIERDKDLEAKKEEMNEFNEKLKNKEDLLKNYEIHLKEFERNLKTYESTLSNKNEYLASLDEKLAKRKEELLVYDDKLEKKNAEIGRISNYKYKPEDFKQYDNSADDAKKFGYKLKLWSFLFMVVQFIFMIVSFNVEKENLPEAFGIIRIVDFIGVIILGAISIIAFISSKNRFKNGSFPGMIFTTLSIIFFIASM